MMDRGSVEGLPVAAAACASRFFAGVGAACRGAKLRE